jgi:hypothetical protein
MFFHVFVIPSAEYEADIASVISQLRIFAVLIANLIILQNNKYIYPWSPFNHLS